ncbi:MAG TPA: hypothetical protein DEG17_12025 [Cyanobacteria bacterium UBA11149]|nr:hypothetical protein [Cyanobacteria bacterium UBA11367]HBE60572.1 hypothetical protein [Cyanobacteria bacterium UBA11366]HBK63431.1 hypothetical protein [Cyanobacteria bacterium UBA11166]HBR72909.1 hypothetical protein [Cyanobacteria bacterium UBA11159]HBS69021.1 hypothetical protein [Cyanobacteria bacterium UBA11153]HBW89574.1 hypothetical protein [Cyanobacteria bacterium UBA11149]HCA93411.1 hypothetical protein [Cyanobacteria bacterium UBA9226]
MKRLLCTATLTLALTSLVPAARAYHNPSAYQNVTHFVHSGAHPNSARVPNATHHFELKVAGNTISKLSIHLPEGIRISQGIEVTDDGGNKIDATISINDTNATIAFTQPVSPGTRLSIEMKGVKTPFYLAHDWLYHVFITQVGMTAQIPIGTANIQTYN